MNNPAVFVFVSVFLCLCSFYLYLYLSRPLLSLTSQTTFFPVYTFVQFNQSENPNLPCSNQAYATLLTSWDVLPTALQLSFTLKNIFETSRDVVLITPLNLSNDDKAALYQAGFDVIWNIDPLVLSQSNNTCLTSAATQDTSSSFINSRDFEVIYIWNLTQYSKILYLHVTTLVHQSLDPLFSHPFSIFDASPSYLFSDFFDPSFMIIKPCHSLFSTMMNSLMEQKVKVCSFFFWINLILRDDWLSKDFQEVLKPFHYTTPISNSAISCVDDEILMTDFQVQVLALSGLSQQSFPYAKWSWSRHPCVEKLRQELRKMSLSSQQVKSINGNSYINLDKNVSRLCKKRMEYPKKISPIRRDTLEDQNQQFKNDSISRMAYMTLLKDTTEISLRKAEVLIESMRNATPVMNSIVPFVAVVPEDTIDIVQERLENAGYQIWRMSLLFLPSNICVKESQLYHTFQIFRNWDYEKVIYVKLESIILKEISHWFSYLDSYDIVVSTKMYQPGVLSDSAIAFVPSPKLWSDFLHSFIAESQRSRRCLSTGAVLTRKLLYKNTSYYRPLLLGAREYFDLSSFENFPMPIADKEKWIRDIIDPSVLGYISGNKPPVGKIRINGVPIEILWTNYFSSSHQRIIEKLLSTRAESVSNLRSAFLADIKETTSKYKHILLLHSPWPLDISDYSSILGLELLFSDLGFEIHRDIKTTREVNSSSQSPNSTDNLYIHPSEAMIVYFIGNSFTKYSYDDTFQKELYEVIQKFNNQYVNYSVLFILNFNLLYPNSLHFFSQLKTQHRNVRLFFSAKDCFQYAQQHFSHISSFQIPDPSIMLPDQLYLKDLEFSFDGIWLSHQLAFPEERTEENGTLYFNTSISQIPLDSLVYHEFSISTAKNIIVDFLHVLNQGKILITTHFSGIMFALLLHKPVIVIADTNSTLQEMFFPHFLGMPGIHWVNTQQEALEIFWDLISAYYPTKYYFTY